MTGPMSGPGVGLALPQNLYPSELGQTPYDASNNQICLAPGQELPIPRGDWLVSTGMYSIIEYLDPVTGVWVAGTAAGWGGDLIAISSDGFSVRIANRLGCPVGGIVNSYGGGWVQASTTMAVVGGGGSTWQPLVGGQVVPFTTVAGAGYGVAPILLLPAPPGNESNPNGVGGIQAAAFAVLTGGTISAISITNPGAGYPSGFTVVALPNPTDPNINTGITLGTIAFSTTGAGSITGVLCTNPGAPLSTPNNITLTLAGAGTNATVSAIMMQTVTAASVVGGFTVTGATVSALLGAVGGYPLSAGPATPALGTITNGPVFNLDYGRPRPMQAALAVTGAGAIAAQVGTIYDGGLFYSPVTPILSAAGGLGAATGGVTVTGVASINLTMGSKPDIITIQPLKV